jgi:hypothetical protein
MLNNLKTMLSFFGANCIDIIVDVMLMVSEIIVIIGFFKLVIFNRIKNKEIRRAVLALTNVAACFARCLTTNKILDPSKGHGRI